jgi:hypothetical protein
MPHIIFCDYLKINFFISKYKIKENIILLKFKYLPQLNIEFYNNFNLFYNKKF